MRRSIALGFGLIAAAYVGLASANPMGTTVHGDGYYTYLWARSIVFDGDIDFHDDYRLCPDPWGLAHTPIGDDQNYWNMGPSLFWVPILAFDRLTHPSARSQNLEVAKACVEPLPDRAVTGSMVAGLLAVLMGFLIARRHFGDGIAFFGAAGIGLLTGLAYYSTMMLSYGHAASSFSGGLLIWAWDAHRKKPSARGWVLMGAALGLAMLMRAQNGVLVVLPFASWLAQAWGHVRTRDPSTSLRTRVRLVARHVALGFAFVGIVLVVFFPQVWFWHHTTGSWITVTQGEHYMRFADPRIVNALFSPNGLVPWTPIHYLAFFGLAALTLRRRTRALGLGMLALFALDSWIVGATYDWWGSVGFPGRRFDLLAVPFMLGLAAFGHEIWRWAVRRRVGAGLALSAGLLIAPLALLNVAVSVGVARGMRTDVAQSSPVHWRNAQAQVMDPIWEHAGNPLTWPGSIPFAIEHGTHPRRWDLVGGQELFYHDHQTLSYRPFESTLVFGERDHHLYVDGPSASETVESIGGQRGVRIVPGHARVFLPMHFPDAGRLDLTVHAPAGSGRAAKVGVTINGARLGTQRVESGRTETLQYAIPAGVTHHRINEAWIWVAGSDVLLVRAQLQDLQPPPRVLQEQNNARVREEVRRATGR